MGIVPWVYWERSQLEADDYGYSEVLGTLVQSGLSASREYTGQRNVYPRFIFSRDTDEHEFSITLWANSPTEMRIRNARLELPGMTVPLQLESYVDTRLATDWNDFEGPADYAPLDREYSYAIGFHHGEPLHIERSVDRVVFRATLDVRKGDQVRTIEILVEFRRTEWSDLDAHLTVARDPDTCPIPNDSNWPHCVWDLRGDSRPDPRTVLAA